MFMLSLGLKVNITFLMHIYCDADLYNIEFNISELKSYRPYIIALTELLYLQLCSISVKVSKALCCTESKPASKQRDAAAKFNPCLYPFSGDDVLAPSVVILLFYTITPYDHQHLN